MPIAPFNGGDDSKRKNPLSNLDGRSAYTKAHRVTYEALGALHARTVAIDESS